jgi:hypothetical protein
MDQQAIIKDKPPAETVAAPSPAEREPMPRMALAAPEIEMEPIETLKIDAAIIGKPKIDLTNIPAPTMAPDVEESKPPTQEAITDSADDDAMGSGDSARSINRFALLAAALALAAGVGAMAGVLAAATLLRPAPVIAMAGAKTGLEEIHALKENIVQARVELAALKVGMDGGIRNASAQFTKLGERIERLERMQSEPAARLSKAIDTLERLTRGETAGHATGSIPAATASTPPPAGTVVDGWVVREVHRGTALIEGRLGLIEVDKGDTVPGLGRVDAIRKQDGRWVVVTSKGLILSPR